MYIYIYISICIYSMYYNFVRVEVGSRTSRLARVAPAELWGQSIDFPTRKATSLSLSIYIYIYILFYICIHTYIYIYIERERERKI